MADKLKILFKYPSRNRPDRFFDGLNNLVGNLQDKENYHISVTLDVDDLTCNTAVVNERLSGYQNLSVGWGKSLSKVNAINRDMPDYDWDIICNHSDDMRWQVYGFDNMIRAEFDIHGLDTLLHIPDQDAKEHLATMYIAGKDYYNRFGFIYNEVYKNLFCDNEVMEIAKKIGRYRYIENCKGILHHLNPAYGHLPKDEMFIEQQLNGWSEDEKTYNQRKANNFYL